MLSLSQTAGYAILALSCLDPTGEDLVMEKDIAERTGIKKPYLSKILHRLGQSGLIITKRGYKGGIALAKPSNEICILEITDAVDGTDWRKRCLLGLPNCSSENPCPLHRYWLVERPKIEKELSSFKLDQLIKFQKNGWRLSTKAEIVNKN